MIKKLLPVVLGLMLAGGGFFAYTTFFAGGGPVETPVQAQAKEMKLDAKSKTKRLKEKIQGPIVSLGGRAKPTGRLALLRSSRSGRRSATW